MRNEWPQSLWVASTLYIISFLVFIFFFPFTWNCLFFGGKD